MAMDLRKDMERHTVPGDGNCIFGSVGFCVSEDHTAMRKAAVAEVRSYPNIYEQFLTVPGGVLRSHGARQGFLCIATDWVPALPGYDELGATCPEPNSRL